MWDGTDCHVHCKNGIANRIRGYSDRDDDNNDSGEWLLHGVRIPLHWYWGQARLVVRKGQQTVIGFGVPFLANEKPLN